MKYLSLTIIAAIFSLSLLAGNGGKSDKIYSELKSSHDCFSMSLSKEMIDAFDIDIDLNGKQKWITGDFLEGRFLVINNIKNASDVKKAFLKEGYQEIDLEEEVDNLETSNEELYLVITKSGNVVKEAHFIVSNDDSTVLLSIYGNMNVKKQK
tara:strand:- start:10 stop:468 length:459 start_codon:yes stop_codon:yes gene_type:complete